MKAKIHPSYVQAHVRCTCGNEFTTRATQEEIHVEVCSNFQRRVAKGRLRSGGQSGGGQSGASQPQAQPQ
jgi:hypothetical protein